MLLFNVFRRFARKGISAATHATHFANEVSQKKINCHFFRVLFFFCAAARF